MNIEELPPEIYALTGLTHLNLSFNRIRELSPQLGALTKLQELNIADNPLISPPQEVVTQGTAAILSFLRSRSVKTEQQWVSKLLVVGEGGVGKTQLLRHLRGETFDPTVPTTHGIAIHTCKLKHPTRNDVEMSLNAWDFGGQQIYHATHQFFLTSRSLFVLAWNARLGYEQGRLYYWLDTIQALAPESPILLVATHIDEREPDLPIAQLQQQYKQLVGQVAVSNSTGQGLKELCSRVASLASRLPLMGESWPSTWLRAAESIRSLDLKAVTPRQLMQIMTSHQVPPDGVAVLTRWLHELGDILHFPDDHELSDTIIMKPQWVSEYIGKVLVSDDVIQRHGVLTRDELRRVWNDLSNETQKHFLRLMERFDLSYRTLEDRDVSLIVERLSHDPPAYDQEWETARTEAHSNQLSMRFALRVVPAGIPTWFIARSHRFTTYTHWRTGALLADGPERKHKALVRANVRQGSLELVVRGPRPHDFFALLRDGIELTLARFPGLEVVRTVPCSGHDGRPCSHEFDFTHLTRAIERRPPVLELQCPISFEMVSVPGLLFGIHWSTQGTVIERIDRLQTELTDEFGELKALVQREFLKLFRVEQQNVDVQCPNVFVLRPLSTGRMWRQLVGERVELELYCQAPGEWHPAGPTGRYELQLHDEWLKEVAPYINAMVKVLKFIAPVAGAAFAVAAPAIADVMKNDVRFMQELIKILPEPKRRESVESLRGDAGAPTTQVSGNALRAIRAVLDGVDPGKQWGGLSKVLTPEGHYLWLCGRHASTLAH